MAWVVHYWDEINNRNISSSEISTRDDAMQKACNLMQQSFCTAEKQRATTVQTAAP